MEVKYILWYLILLDDLPISIDPISIDGIDYSNCPVDDCHKCDRIQSCELLQHTLIPAKGFIAEYVDYDTVKRDITNIINNKIVLSIFLLKMDTCIGYIYKGNCDVKEFSRDVIPAIQEAYTYVTQKTSLIINTIEDVRGCIVNNDESELLN